MKTFEFNAFFKQTIRQIIIFDNLICFEKQYLNDKKLMIFLQFVVENFSNLKSTLNEYSRNFHCQCDFVDQFKKF